VLLPPLKLQIKLQNPPKLLDPQEIGAVEGDASEIPRLERLVELQEVLFWGAVEARVPEQRSEVRRAPLRPQGEVVVDDSE
jgi:hypothetical protein